MAASDFLILTFSLLSISPVEGQSCAKSYLDFSFCLSQRLDAAGTSLISQQALLTREVQLKIARCFKDNGCDSPNFGHDPSMDLPMPIGSFVDKVRQEIGTAPPQVEQCLKVKFTRSTGECVAALGLSQLLSNGQAGNTGQIYGDVAGFFFTGNNSTNQSQTAATDRKRAALVQINIATAVRLCKEQNGNDDTRLKPILQCVMAAAAADAQRSTCQEANNCDSDEASNDCKRQHRQFLRVLCQCRRKNRNEVLSQLDDLRRRNASVEVLEVVRVLGNGKKPDETSNDIRSCFTQNGQPSPPALSLLDLYISMQQKRDPTDKAISTAQMFVDRDTLSLIRDLYDAGDYGDDECNVCDVSL